MRALPREVWWVDGDRLSLVPAPEQRKLFSGDCYILQYTYLGNERDENLFYAWLGGGSVMEDRTDTISHMNAIVESSRGILLWLKLWRTRSHLNFFSILQTLIVFKGGRSQRYKKFVVEKGIADETYDDSKTARFRVQGTSPNNMQAI